MTRVQILVPISFSKKKYKDSLKKQLILGLGQVIYKISLEHLVLPESKEVIEKKKWRYVKAISRANLKELPVAKTGKIGVNKISNVVVDYIPNYKINAHKSNHGN